MPPGFIIDEASLLSLDVFAELHTITQFEGDSKPWLPIILAGQNNLADNLLYRTAVPLVSRVVTRYHFQNVERQGMADYLEHHLKTFCPHPKRNGLHHGTVEADPGSRGIGRNHYLKLAGREIYELRNVRNDEDQPED